MYRDLTVQSQNEIRAILTEEQRNRYEEWITRLERRNRDRNGGGRNRDREDDGEENNRRPDE
jgi:Spy/CpxP family protein refolding chaperone